MKTYLITFSNLENDLVNRIKEYGNWAKINSNTFCIKVENMTVAQIRDNLSPYCSDFFIVIEITDSAWASFRLNKEVASWLK